MTSLNFCRLPEPSCFSQAKVSAVCNVTKPAREGLKEGKQNASRKKFTVQFLSNTRANHFNNLNEAANVII